MSLTAGDKLALRQELIDKGLLKPGNPANVREMVCPECNTKFERLKDNTYPICPSCDHPDPRRYR